MTFLKNNVIIFSLAVKKRDTSILKIQRSPEKAKNPSFHCSPIINYSDYVLSFFIFDILEIIFFNDIKKIIVYTSGGVYERINNQC